MYRYICEISPPSQRGPLTAGPQLLVTLGLVAGFFTCYGTTNMGSSLAWRIPFIILACLSIVFALASILWLVPSPRWLTLCGRQSEAPAAWEILGIGYAERDKAELQQNGDLTLLGGYIHAEAPNQQDAGPPLRIGKNLQKLDFLDVFSLDTRWRTTLAVFMMGMQQLSGIDGVLYVSFKLHFMNSIKIY
jgi:DNA-directed RNA polymerase III subunit RPC2